jgi:MFS family permease
MSWLWRRQLDTYPDTAHRIMYLGITVLSTVMLYYALYVGGSVSTLYLVKLNMTFSFLVYTVAFGALIGAFGSLFAGITDRFGRTNIVVVGLFVTAIFTGFIIPLATDKWVFTILTWIVAAVEGMCLVATPALIRDFSPQVGRATAMGFWTSGPVLGSLIVFLVASHTIGEHPSPSYWTHEFRIAGIAGLVVAGIALVGLKELSPRLRDQLMVTMKDRALIEARAKGLDIEAALRQPFRQLLKPDIIVSSVGISVFLVIYYTAVLAGLIYFTTVFGFSVKDGDALGNWNWGFNVIAVILIGFVSDFFRVRKPFMIIGGAAAAIMTVLYLEQAGHHPGYYHVAVLVAALSFCLGIAYVPWMASYTETVEHRNPALTATGLAIWGWIIRVIVFISYLILPSVINTVTPLVTYGGAVSAVVAQYPQQVQTLAVIHPDTLAALQKTPPDAAAAGAAIGQISSALHVTPAQATQRLLAVAALPPAAKATLAHAPAVAKAAKDTAGQWKTWYWICFGCMIFFLLTVPLMRGRWSPKAARRDEDEHEAMVQAELAKLATADASS